MANGWQTVPLAQVLRQDTNYVTELEPITYPKLSVKLYGKGVTLDAPADGANVKMQRHQFAKPGQVIVSEIWAKKGAIGIVPPDGEGALVTSHFFLFDIDETKVLPAFIGWLLKGNFFAELLDAQAHGTTGYAAVRPKQFLALEIPLPPLTEQHRIVARIEALAARVAQAQSLRREASEEAENLITSTLREIFIKREPKVPLGNVIQLQRGYDLPKQDREEGKYPIFAANGEVGRHNEYRVKAPGVLTGRSGSVGSANFVEEDYWPLNTSLYVKDFKNNDPKLVYYLIRAISSELKDVSSHTAVPTLDRKNAHSKIFVHMPAHTEQRRLVAYLDGLQGQVSALRAAQAETERELSALMPSVLDRAFKGEL